MSNKRVIATDKAPPGLKGIYSQAIVANGTVYCAGSIAMDPVTGKVIDGDVAAHTVSPWHDSPSEVVTNPHGSTNALRISQLCWKQPAQLSTMLSASVSS